MPIKNYTILPIFLLVFSWPTSASENVILARITNMQKASSDMTKIRKSISNSDYQQAREAAESIKNWANIELNEDYDIHKENKSMLGVRLGGCGGSRVLVACGGVSQKNMCRCF